VKPSIWIRKAHYWVSISLALPLLVIVGSGLLLQWKKQAPWIQPTEQEGSAKEPTVSLQEVLEACRAVPQAEVESWSDVDRVDVRPKRGMLKVVAESGWEVQLDAATGDVLQVAFRRSDTIEGIHDGSWFHAAVKFGLFVPVGLGVLFLLASGVYLFFVPILARRRGRLLRSRGAAERRSVRPVEPGAPGPAAPRASRSPEDPR
jgi:uncharacterized iron-regulated membrane protein